jgi:hypothetical protein
MKTPVLVTALLLLTGCGGDGVSSAPVPLEAFCQRYAEITCKAADKCGCLTDLTRAYCPSFQLSSCQDDVDDKVSSGKYDYDAAKAGSCLAATAAVISDCSVEGDSLPDSCDQIAVGKVPAGQACSSGSECAPGLDCIDDRCAVLPGTGEACLAEHYCAKGHYCGSDNICHPYVTSGGPCADSASVCAEKLYCDSRSSTCQPYLGAGDGCAHDGAVCGDDLYCSPSSHTCRAYPGKGGDCADSDGVCADGYYCDSTEHCAARQPEGASCSEDWECASDDCTQGQCAAGGSCPFM